MNDSNPSKPSPFRTWIKSDKPASTKGFLRQQYMETSKYNPQIISKKYAAKLASCSK